jgi:hypothetical protein
MCKPHKTGGSNRWKYKELDEIKESEKMIKEFVSKEY